MKYPYHDPTPRPLPADITYTYEPGPRPDRAAAIAQMYCFTFIEEGDGWLCWAARNDGKIICRVKGATRDEARTSARELAGVDFDKIVPDEKPGIDTRGLRLA